jgi:hypothetical protein
MSAKRVDALLPLREDVHREKLLQAKALILCALPYRRIETPSVTRHARLGRDSRLVVTYTSVLAGVPLPYGADRALFAWIQTKAYGDGDGDFDSLTDFFEAFGIGRGGRDYEAFRGRLNRLQSLAISLAVETPSDVRRLNLHPCHGGSGRVRSWRTKLHLVEPRAVGRCEMEPDVGMSLEELVNPWRFVGAEVVEHDVDFPVRGLAGNQVLEKGDELEAGMPADGFAQDLTAAGVEGRIERQRAVADVRLCGDHANPRATLRQPELALHTPAPAGARAYSGGT